MCKEFFDTFNKIMKDKQKSENNINNLTRDLYLIKNKFKEQLPELI